MFVALLWDRKPKSEVGCSHSEKFQRNKRRNTTGLERMVVNFKLENVAKLTFALPCPSVLLPLPPLYAIPPMEILLDGDALLYTGQNNLQ